MRFLQDSFSVGWVERMRNPSFPLLAECEKRGGYPSKIQRTLRLLVGTTPDRVCVDHGRLHIAVAQQLLDGADVIVRLEQMGGKTVTKGMGCGALGNPGLAHRLLYRPLHVRSMQMISPVFSSLLLAQRSGFR